MNKNQKKNKDFFRKDKGAKDFETISKCFRDNLIPLFSSMLGNRKGYVEGIVFTHPDGRMAKLRRDMFEWFYEK